jgi:hypothetical protein
MGCSTFSIGEISRIPLNVIIQKGINNRIIWKNNAP